MRRRPARKRDILIGTLLVTLLAVAMVCLTLFLRSRHYLDERYYTAPRAFDDSIRKSREEERAWRQKDYEAQRAKWDAEKAERRARREAWRDSQQVWAERRAQWAREKEERARSRAQRQAYYDSLKALRPAKFPAGTVVDANAADTLTLQRVPGIGPSLARSIARYRQFLGGFVSPMQIEEVQGVPSGTAKWFTIGDKDGENPVQRLDLNRDDFRTLVRHPYLSYDQVREIVYYRRRRPILSLRSLSALPSFTDEDIRRLEPYVSF